VRRERLQPTCIYVSGYVSSTLFVVDGATGSVMGAAAVGSSPWGVAMNPDTNRIYVANAGSNNVSVIEDPPPVGSIAQLPDVSDSAARYVALAEPAAALLALTAGGWYARRRWSR
jgi:YVTN family beta-propeller protein